MLDMEIILGGSFLTLLVGIIGFFAKKELSTINSRLNHIDTILKAHDRQIAINAEKDSADYRVVQAEIIRMRQDMDKDIINITTIMDTKLGMVQTTLERILNKLDEYDKRPR